MKIVVLVSGSGTLLQALIDNLDSSVEIVAVGSDVPCAGIDRAQAADIPTFTVKTRDFGNRKEWNTALAQELSSWSPDYVVSAGFMKIIGNPVLDLFPQSIINTHPALLPSFPGAHAVQDAYDAGVKVSGNTIHFVDSGVDTGPIIAQTSVVVEESDTVETLQEKIKTNERTQLVNVLHSFANNEYTLSGRKVLHNDHK